MFAEQGVKILRRLSQKTNKQWTIGGTTDDFKNLNDYIGNRFCIIT